MPGKTKAKRKKFSREDLACAICLGCLKEPKLLPCLHTYCKACLEGLLRKSKNNQITCPQCRLNHPLPTGGVGGFPADLVLENALDFYTFKESQANDTTLPCSMCTEDDPSIAHCSTCSRFLCDFCAKAHKRLVNFRDHKVVTLDQLSSDVVKSLERPRYCCHHPEETLKLYCNTCQALICRDCSIIAHRDHRFNFARDVRSEVQLQLEQAVKRVTVKQQEFEAHLAFIKEAEKTRDAYSVTLSQQVNEAFDSFIRSLESLRKQLLGEETEAKASDMKQIWAQKQSIEMTLANIASGLRYAERLRGCPSDVDMLAMSSTARKQLVSLQKAQWNPKSDLTCSPLLLFSSKGQEYVKSVATLKALSPDVFTISIQPHSPTQSTTVPLPPTTVRSTTVSIGTKAQFLVEVRAKERTDIMPLMVPSISIKSGGEVVSSSSHLGKSLGASVPAAPHHLTQSVTAAPVQQHHLTQSVTAAHSHSGGVFRASVPATHVQSFSQVMSSQSAGGSSGRSKRMYRSSFGAKATPMQSFPQVTQPGYDDVSSPSAIGSSEGIQQTFGAKSAPMQSFPQVMSKKSAGGSSGGSQQTYGSSFGAIADDLMQSFPQPGYDVGSSPSAIGSSEGIQQTYGHSVKYTMKHKRGGFWLVEFMPLRAGQFTVSAGISDSGMGSKQAEDRHGVTVTGTFNIGGRVRHGPDWTLGNTDGGIGNKGTVIEEQEYTANYRSGKGHYSEPKTGRQRYTYVRWDNGNYGQYSCNQGGPYQLELVPDEEK